MGDGPNEFDLHIHFHVNDDLNDRRQFMYQVKTDQTPPVEDVSTST